MKKKDWRYNGYKAVKIYILFPPVKIMLICIVKIIPVI